jgi:hypothetical protein
MLTWEELRTATVDKWQTVKSLLPEQETEAVIQAIASACSFCDYADELMSGEGGDERCDYCLHAVRYGSCRGMMHRVLEKLNANRWEGLEREVDQILEHLESIKEQPAA